MPSKNILLLPYFSATGLTLDAPLVVILFSIVLSLTPALVPVSNNLVLATTVKGVTLGVNAAVYDAVPTNNLRL